MKEEWLRKCMRSNTIGKIELRKQRYENRLKGKSMEEKSSLKLDEKAEKFLKGHFEDVYKCRGDNFANGRYVRNIFEKVLSNQADRLVNMEDISDDDLNTLIIEDFEDCL